MQKVNPAVPLPKIIPDADSLKLLDTIIGEVAYRSDTNLIVWGPGLGYVKTIQAISEPGVR